ncbi:MAG: TIGR01212 family radical SAM protein, partial [Bacteroidales bacterium]|nr:TIGR01212 family radical SAM protein [Bacteroidales bacterium]
MNRQDLGGHRYNSFTGYFKRKYGCRLQKVVIDAGFTCPNRDGTAGLGGCTYCDNRAFHPSYSTPDKSISEQIDEGIEFHKVRYRHVTQYLAYFQPYSNTYAPLGKLKALYSEALAHPGVRGIVLGTRPDCMDDAKLAYLKELSERHVVIIEYGIESCFDETLLRINRGHDFQCAVNTVNATAGYGIEQCAHFIFGLPGESKEMMLDEASIINGLPVQSLKFHQLQIVKGTAMEKEFSGHPGEFVTWSLDEYIDFFISFLERLDQRFLIERFIGEVPPRFVNATPWGLIRNVDILRMLDKRMEE